MPTNHPIYMFKKAPYCNINYSKNKMSSKYFTYLNKNTEISNLLDATFHNIPYLKFSLLQEMAQVCEAYILLNQIHKKILNNKSQLLKVYIGTIDAVLEQTQRIFLCGTSSANSYQSFYPENKPLSILLGTKRYYQLPANTIHIHLFIICYFFPTTLCVHNIKRKTMK